MDISKLSDPWLLDTEESALIETRNTAKNKLAFAVLLKCFFHEGFFYETPEQIPPEAITALANQLGISPHTLRDFNWSIDNTKRFRIKIREFYGYRLPTVKDGELFMDWLTKEILPQAPSLLQCREKSILFFREYKLEPFSDKEREDYIKTARHRFEQALFQRVFGELLEDSIKKMDKLLSDDEQIEDNELVDESTLLRLRHFKRESIGTQLQMASSELTKLKTLQEINLPHTLLKSLPRKIIKKYYHRIAADFPSLIKEREPCGRYAMLAIFCHLRIQIITDTLADLLIKLILALRTRSESQINKQILKDVKKINGKYDILLRLSETAYYNPKGVVDEVIYSAVNPDLLKKLIDELHSQGRWYQEKVHTQMKLLYSPAHRKTRLALLAGLRFSTHQEECQPLLRAMDFIIANKETVGDYYPDAKLVPVNHVIPAGWLSVVVESHEAEDSVVSQKIHKMNYEVAVFEVLMRRLCTKDIWLEMAYRYRHPKEDEIAGFDDNPDYYFKLLDAPRQASDFVNELKTELDSQLMLLNESMQTNDKVQIMPNRKKSKIKITPSDAQPEPVNIIALKKEMMKRWAGVSLLDILKETDLRIGFSRRFHNSGSRDMLSGNDYLRRLLLCLYAIGSNMGIKKCVDASNNTASYSDLRYIKRRYVNVANVRDAVADVLNQLMAIRDPAIFGEATTGCASDSTHMQTWDQNLISSYHPRYRKHGTMIYWHVDKKAACIYSQLKTCTSSEVASMLMGFLWHNTDMSMKECYTDTHGQSWIGFAFCWLLGADLLPRIKGIDKETLFYPSSASKDKYPNLTEILSKPIDWALIEKNYEPMIRYAAALRTGAVEPEVIIRQFGKDNNDPVCKALMEMGRAIKTIFICRYLREEALRIEINESLNVVERVNGIMDFIFYGKLSELSSHQRDEQELSVVCLQLLQVSMVYINTLMIQQILSEPEWKNRLTEEDKRALSPLIHTHINQFGLFILNLTERIAIENYHPQDTSDERANPNSRQKKSSRVSKTA